MKVGELAVRLSVIAHHEWVGRDGRVKIFAVVGMDGLGPKRSVSTFLCSEEDLKVENQDG